MELFLEIDAHLIHNFPALNWTRKFAMGFMIVRKSSSVVPIAIIV
jgi:hypothetical protein